MGNLSLRLGAFNGFLAVALGAFGAHGLKKAAFLGDAVERAQRIAWWHTAVDYQIWHALLLVALGLVLLRLPHDVKSKALNTAVVAAGVGIVFFSGSLYAMTLTGVRMLGAITPLGGLAFLTSWTCLFVGSKAFLVPKPKNE